MKRNIIWIGILIVFVFGLTIFTGCAEKKATVKEGDTQEQQASTAQSANQGTTTTQGATTGQADKEQSAKVQATATAEASIGDINFDFDKYNIRPDAREILKANADLFLKNGAKAIVIEGHCDERGTAEYNMALGERRAREVKKYMVNLGIKDSRMKTISYGKERPLDAAHNDAAWAKNRRAHFVVTTK
jgi:peptidoglycan-associated lipoprotein